MDAQAPTSPPEDSADRFVWHPEYGGRTVAEVRAELATRIASDQRAYALALEGAEGHETDALASVVPLERTWGPFDMDWAEGNADELADRVLAFELERERRRELFPYAVYRERLQAAAPVSPGPRTTSPVQGGLSGAAIAAGVALLIVLLLVLWLVLR